MFARNKDPINTALDRKQEYIYRDTNLERRIHLKRDSKINSFDITDAQYEALLCCTKTAEDETILRLVGTEGVRVTELKDINVSDYDQGLGILIMRHADHSCKVLKLSEKTKIALDRYLEGEWWLLTAFVMFGKGGKQSWGRLFMGDIVDFEKSPQMMIIPFRQESLEVRLDKIVLEAGLAEQNITFPRIEQYGINHKHMLMENSVFNEYELSHQDILELCRKHSA